MRKRIMSSMLLGAVGLVGTLASPTTAPASAEETPKFEITAGTTGSTEMWTDTPADTGGSHGTRVYCSTSHMSYDDPVVFPGEPAAAHLHTFWGNSETNYASTGQSLLNEGKSSCEGGTNNRSAYWAPTLFNEDDEATLPYDIVVYYKSFGGPNFDRETIQPIPNGLQILANNDVKNSSTNAFRTETVNGNLQLKVNFPTCIAVNNDGTPVLESSDNNGHMSYASSLDGNSNDCPTSHPYRIPQITYNIRYRVNPSSNWYLASDTSAATQGDSLHADYIAAWDTDSMNELVRCNIEERKACEFGDKAGDRSQLEDRHKSPDGNVLYQYGLLKTSVDQTPFGTTLQKSHGHNQNSDFTLKTTSLDSGSGWIVYQNGPNTGKYQWVSETCRTQLKDAGVPIELISNYQTEIGALTPAEPWQTCDALLAN